MNTKKKVAKTKNGYAADADTVIAKSSNGRIKAILPKALLDGDDNELDSRELLQILNEVKNGNFNVRMPIDKVGINGKICDTLNEIIFLNQKMMQEFTTAGNTIGKKG